MKVKDIPILEKKILDMLPITQTEVWNALRINSRDCSRLIIDMVGKGLIKRTKADRTFLLETLNGDHYGEKDEVPIVEKDEVPIVEKDEVPIIEKDEVPIIEKDEIPIIEKAKIENVSTPEPIPENVSKPDRKKSINMTDIKRKILDILPITQPEMWKKLGISRKKGSKLVSTMLEEGLIDRTKVDNVFLLERAGKVNRKKEKDFSALLSDIGNFSPCCGCAIECDPKICNILTEWLM